MNLLELKGGLKGEVFLSWLYLSPFNSGSYSLPGARRISSCSLNRSMDYVPYFFIRPFAR